MQTSLAQESKSTPGLQLHSEETHPVFVRLTRLVPRMHCLAAICPPWGCRQPHAPCGHTKALLTHLPHTCYIHAQRLGASHPHVGATAGNLAYTLQKAGRPKEALPLARQALEVMQAAFGQQRECA